MGCDNARAYTWEILTTEGGKVTKGAVSKHSKELENAVQDEARRREIDAAKKRAAAQNADYPTFAALVSMAHIKPFERKRGQEVMVQRFPTSPAWSFDAAGKHSASQGTFNELNDYNANGGKETIGYTFPQEVVDSQKTHGNQILKAASDLLSPGVITVEKPLLMKTCDAFKREWRRATNFEEKLGLLLAMLPHELSHTFKVELPPSLLTDIIDTLCWWRQCPSKEEPNCASAPNARNMNTSFDAHLASDILGCLSKCGRFLLSLKLVGPKIQARAIDLIDDMIICLGTKTSCNEETNYLLAFTSEDNERGRCLQTQTEYMNKMRALKLLYTVSET